MQRRQMPFADITGIMPNTNACSQKGEYDMNYNYQCVKQMLCDDIIGKYTAYGVRNTANDSVISDVGSNFDIVAGIVSKLNKFQASPVHLHEIIENLILD